MLFADLLPKLRQNSSKQSFILASGSPRRKDILEKLGLPFLVRPSDFAEDLDKSIYVGRPFAYVLDNSKYKALDIYRKFSNDPSLPGLIVGCDTVVAFEGRIYEKPKDENEAFQILSRLNGRVHEVFTGVTLLRPPEKEAPKDEPLIDQFYERTEVKFGQLSESLIRAYIDTKEPLDKAGAYGIQGSGAVLVERIDGDFYNVQGFPLYRFTEYLLRLFAWSTKMTIFSHAMEILRQGIWASLTGGWCYDPRQTLACNVVHMYLWLFLFFLPLIISLCFNITWTVAGVYAIIIGSVFSALKILNYYLHTIFDTHEPIDVVVVENGDGEEDDEEHGEKDAGAGDEENQIGENSTGFDAPAGQRSSTLFDTCENSGPGSSSKGVVYPDDEVIEYATWESARGVANTETSVAALSNEELSKLAGDNQYGRSGHEKKSGRARKSSVKTSTSNDVDLSGVHTASSPDYLAVEADVHSMPSEPVAKDGVLDIEEVELRLVKSDSKLAAASGADIGHGSSLAADVEMSTTEKNFREEMKKYATVKKIFFRSNDTKINDDQMEEVDRFEDDDGEDDHGAMVSSSSSLQWITRKYSEPGFAMKRDESGETETPSANEEHRRDSFDRFGKKLRPAKKGVATVSDVGTNAVRRTRSTVETYAQRKTADRESNDGGGVGTASTSSTLLSESCLEKCRGKGVRKSYPGKTSSTDIFLLQHAGQRKQPSSEGFRPLTYDSNSVVSSGTGLGESGLVGVDAVGNQSVDKGNGESFGQGALSYGPVSRFHSVDVSLTDIPERESESERPDGWMDSELPSTHPQRAASIMESSLATTTTMTNSLTLTDAYGTSRSDGGHGTAVSFYTTASEDSLPRARARIGSLEQLRRRASASSEDHSPQSPRRKLIQNLRYTLETLKSEASTGSTSVNAVGQADRFVADLQALKDASTPDLRYLFDDAAAVLNASSSYCQALSSAGSSPLSRPRLTSLQGQEVGFAPVSTKDAEDRTEALVRPTTLCTTAEGDTASAQQSVVRELVMDEIKRLLEEIIDSHPEALEAIESVRQAKLARIARRAVGGKLGHESSDDSKIPDSYLGDDEEGYVDAPINMVDDPDAPGPSHRGYIRRRRLGGHRIGKLKEGDAAITEDDQEEAGCSSSRNVPLEQQQLALDENELAKRSNIHVAASHDDTSEGAIHYFQDSDGKWYTYTFNDENVATAQLLGSDVALMELIAHQQQEAESRASKHHGRGEWLKSRTGRVRDRRADALRRPPWVRHNAETSRNGHGKSQGQGPAQLKIVLARNGSSSSEESFLTLDAPASVMHVGAAAALNSGASANISRTSSTLPTGETASSARSALPLRLRRLPSSGLPTNGAGSTSSAGSGRRRSAARTFDPFRQILTRAGGSGSVQFATGSRATFAPLDSLNTLPNYLAIGECVDMATGRIFRAGTEEAAALHAGYSTMPLSDGSFLAIPGPLNTPSDMSHSSFRARFLATLAGGVDSLPAVMANTIGGLDIRGQASASSVKRKQYYRVSVCPRFGACCCPNWLTSRLTAWKLWASSRGSNDGDSPSESGWRCCPKRTFKLHLDRLRLIAMFDRNRTKLSIVIDVLLAVIVAFIACGLLSRPLYFDLSFILVCMVTAGAQFSLMKSVQPDAASPVHGYNALAAYSRPVYYCLFGLLVYFFDNVYAYHPANPFATETLYSIWPNRWEFWWNSVRDFWSIFFLFLPVVFTFGLLPQLSTFVIYVLEQIDMLVFGGTASVGLASGIFSVGRSIVCAMILCVLNFVSMQRVPFLQPTPNVVFSASCGGAVALSYLLSRASSDPRLLINVLNYLWTRLLARCGLKSSDQGVDFNSTGSQRFGSEAMDVESSQDFAKERHKSISTEDPLPVQLRSTMILRLKHDFFAASVLGAVYFALHCSTAFTKFSWTLMFVLPSITVAVGFLCHYFLPQLRQHTPWRILATPVLKTYEHRMFDVNSMAKLMPFEILYAILNFLERNVLYPLVTIFLLTTSGEELIKRFGIYWAAIAMSVASMKLLRTAFCNAAQLYLPLGAAVLFRFVDFPVRSLTLILDFYFLALVYPKLTELMLKLQFIFSYVAPWQISWGSAFHAFAQPTAIPHSAFTLAIAAVSSFLSSPLNPFLGSAVFLMSYMRPVKFWEKNYNTKRVDHSNTRLISQIDRGPMTDDSNFNALFYEHLTRSLQRSLAGDLRFGRLATTVNAGDCFVLASFYLNCLVHVVEVGNGFVTFQLRGLEFRGTYCQQREVEAISEEVTDQGCCCCCGDGGTTRCCCLRGFLSLNAIWNLSWLSWRVTAAKFVLEGYSVSDNSALGLLQLIELRKLLVTLYVKCILYYALKSPKLEQWLATDAVVSALEPIMQDRKYVDVDPSFCASNDEDYDCRLNGISRQSFCQQFLPWIEYCYDRRQQRTRGCEENSLLTAFGFALALVGRRVLGTAAQGRHTSGAESFLYGLHALFKGDFRITCGRDEWIFADMDILKSVIARAVRMALKLHQDHYVAPDDFNSMEFLFDSIDQYDRTIFISHENDPAWRHAVLSNTQSLLALRHVFEDGQDDFKIIMLNKRHMNFRVIALNKECVRAFWAGQQQELIFLRNRNPERGSIQNARQVLRNMINSSADQPIGYPIYVSPLTTSFCETHEQVAQCFGAPLTLSLIGSWCSRVWRCLIGSCGASGSSTFSAPGTASSPPAAGLVHYRPSVRGSGDIVQISLSQSQPSEQRQQTSRTRPTPRPRTSLLNAAANRQGDASSTSGTALLSVGRTGGTVRRPLPLPPRHGSAPPIMQRSLTHPLRSPSQIQAVHHHDRQRSPFRVRNRSRDSLTIRQLVNSVVVPAATHLVNSVVATTAATNCASSSTPGPRVSLSSLLALNVDLEDERCASGQSNSGRRGERVRIVDASSVLDNLDKQTSATGKTPVTWPNEEWRRRGGRLSWKSWKPEKDMEGSVVHKWTPWNADPKRRSHLDKTIYLVDVLDGKYYVPVLEQGVENVGDEV